MLFEYLVLINLFAGLFFIIDKIKARSNSFRISEVFLHILEFLGGVFSTVVLMILIRHKNRKASFYLISYLILIIWIFLLFNFFKYYILF